ncbi:hypothetical protein ACIHEI_23550 [Kitasatospora sp. NPDC051984]|uniref:hypothetical protein n=1 Tax=Kitasatospora sp. NPDC051984 TaxID=3364059 RepID=UPI0037CC5F48
MVTDGSTWESARPWNDVVDQLQGLGQQVEQLGAAGELRDAGLESRLADTRADLDRVATRLTEVAGTLAQTKEELRQVRRTAEATHAALNSFVERYGRDQRVADAQAELTRLTTEWTAGFAQRQRIRALARGLVHGLTEDAAARGVLATSTLDAYSQEQLILEPSFWLAPAVVAVAADFSGDAERAGRARSYAQTLDQPKATLFFALTSSRQKRQDLAARWMDLYLAGLNPNNLGLEFSVVLDAVAGAELGFEAYTYARQAMARWDREAHARSHFGFDRDGAAPQLKRWRPWMLGHGRSDSEQFAALARLCGTHWPELRRGWQAATGVKGTLDFLQREYSDVPTPREPGVGTDLALNHLISQLDPDERDMKDRMDRLRSIIRHRGDLDAMDSEPESPTAEDTQDFQSILERAIFRPKSVQLGYSARLLSLHSTWLGLRAAVEAAAAESATKLPSGLTITMDGWSCRLPAAPLRPEAAQQILAGFQDYLNRSTDRAIDSVAPVWPRIVAHTAAAALLGGLAVFLAGAAAGLAVVASAGLIGSATWGVLRVPLQRSRLREDCARRRNSGGAELAKALDQHSRMLRQWRTGLAAAGRAQGWSPAAAEDAKRQSGE